MKKGRLSCALSFLDVRGWLCLGSEVGLVKTPLSLWLIVLNAISHGPTGVKVVTLSISLFC